MSIQVQHGIDYRLIWKIVGGSVAILLVVLLWLKKLRALNRKLEKLSITDRLTGLYNRLKLDEALESEVARAPRSGQTFSVILIDIDHFKQVNDQHGHQTGDQLLTAIAEILRAGTRATDFVGRWGGEEFLIVCPHTDAAGATRLAENLRQTIQDYRFPVVAQKTASFGVASFRPDDTVKEIVARADTALYAAKDAGRNKVEAV